MGRIDMPHVVPRRTRYAHSNTNMIQTLRARARAQAQRANAYLRTCQHGSFIDRQQRQAIYVGGIEKHNTTNTVTVKDTDTEIRASTRARMHARTHAHLLPRVWPLVSCPLLHRPCKHAGCIYQGRPGFITHLPMLSCYLFTENDWSESSRGWEGFPESKGKVRAIGVPNESAERGREGGRRD